MVENEREICELDTVALNTIDLDIFALAKRNKRQKTFVRIVQRLV